MFWVLVVLVLLVVTVVMCWFLLHFGPESGARYTWRTLYEDWRTNVDPTGTPQDFMPKHPGNPRNRRWWTILE